MKVRIAALLVLLMPVSQEMTVAQDLGKIDRTIKKEPAYAGKPKYCLLVFGPEAKTRVWLIIDGDTLYVDREGDVAKVQLPAMEAEKDGPIAGSRQAKIGTVKEGKYTDLT